MRNSEIAYLGPEGTFSHFIARKRFPKSLLVPLPTIPEVFDFTKESRMRRGIVPIENSSGGIIFDSVDMLIDPTFQLVIQEELGLHVRLALAGKKGEPIERVYSHFAPLQHCLGWLQKHYPAAQPCRVVSTSEAVRLAAVEKNVAALCHRAAALAQGLDILEFPVEKQLANFTQFFLLGHQPNLRQPTETSLLVALRNECGSLNKFLTPFSDEKLNLKRIVSRNVAGRPNTYVFFMGVEGNAAGRAMRRALRAAQAGAEEIRVLGSYPTRPPFVS